MRRGLQCPNRREARSSGLAARPIDNSYFPSKVHASGCRQDKRRWISQQRILRKTKVAMKYMFSPAPAVRSTRRLAARVSLFVCLAAFAATTASAQLSVVGGSKPLFGTGGILIGNDVSYDPAHGVYLVIAGYGEVWG